MSYFMVDVETDGPVPGTEDYSMIMIGAVLVRKPLETAPRFLGRLRPISPRWDPKALDVTKTTREETLTFDDPSDVIRNFESWVALNNRGKRAQFISDNNGFDYMFATWYLYHFLGRSPFGHTSTNLGSLYKGLVADTFKNFKHLRKTTHTHDPVDDAMGNAEALVTLQETTSLNILLE